MHGGASTGPRTKRGLARCRRASWKHGRYSAEAKLEAKQLREFVRESRDPMHRDVGNGNVTKDHKSSQENAKNGFTPVDVSRAYCCEQGWSGRRNLWALAAAVEFRAKQHPEMTLEEIGEGLEQQFMRSGFRYGPLKYFQEGVFTSDGKKREDLRRIYERVAGEDEPQAAGSLGKL